MAVSEAPGKPFKRNLVIYQGATFYKKYTWKAGTPAAAVDLTGCTALLQMRATHSSADALIELTDGDGITLGDAAGTIVITMPPADTEAVAWKKAVWDIEITFPSGYKRRFIEGQVTVSPEVSRAE